MACAWGALIALYAGIRVGNDTATPLSSVLFGFACFSLFWAGSCFDFLWGLAHGNLMVTLWLFLSLSCLVAYVQRRRKKSPTEARRLLAFSAVTAFLATFSHGAGVSTWLSLIAISVVARLPWKVTASFAAGTVLTVALYSVGLEKHPAVSIEIYEMTLLQRPFDLLEFTAAFVGGMFGWTADGLGFLGEDWIYPISACAGAMGMIAFTALGLSIARRPEDASPLALLAFGLMAFGLAAGFVVGLNRVWLRAEIAVAIRFVNWSAIFWTGGAFAIPSFAKPDRRGRRAAVAVVLLPVFSLCMLPAMQRAREVQFERKSGFANTSLMLLLGIEDTRALKRLTNRHPEWVQRVAPRLKADRRGLFADPRAELPGAFLRDRFEESAAGDCVGEMRVRRRGARPWIAVRGWVKPRVETVDFIVIEDAKGIIRGLGELVERVPPTGAKTPPEAGSLAWAGYIAGTGRSASYTAYGVLADGRSVCRLSAQQ